ncbi:MAG TPA: hypothetical protein VNE39_18450 [Planctomycetota bacterium]|nr:hypothetical protein [Planctomycetota bacterium]
MQNAISVALALAVGAACAGEGAFATRPAAVQDGAKVRITFAVAAPTNVEVSALGVDGTVVRHLAAGVLGGDKAPPPPLKAGLSQSLEWDLRDDFGKPAQGGPFRVRVRAGMGVRFGRFLGGDDPYTFGLIASMVSDEQGNLYAVGYREEDSLTCMTLRAFSPEGKYLRTLMPFPADLEPGAMRDVAAWDDEGKCFRPRNYRSTNVQFYLLMGGNGSGMTPSVTLHLVAATKEHGILLTDGRSLFRLDARGAVAGEKFKTRPLWAAGTPPRCGHTYAALSPDGKALYISGRYSAKSRYGHPYDPRYPPGVVYRLTLDGDAPAEPFATIKVEHQDGLGGNWTADGGDWAAYGLAGAPKGPVHGVAADARGRVYVADRERGRVAVFDESGKEVGHVAVRWPDQLAVHPRTGALYVLEKRCVPRKSVDLKLMRFDSIGPDARPAAEHEIAGTADLVAMAFSFPGDRALCWLRTSITKAGKYSLLALEDKGKAFEPVETAYQPRPDSQWGWHRLAVDFDRDEVYGSDGTVGMWRYDGKTGNGIRLMKDGKPFWSQDLAVGYHGLLYARQGRGAPEFQDYSGPFARYTRDLEPAPFAGTGTHVLSQHIYSREGPGYAERGLGVGPDGRSYISFMYDWATYWVVCYGPDGKFQDGQHLEVKDKEGKSRGRATIGPVNPANGGIRVDLAGNIYLGLWNWPKDAPVPAKWAKDLSYLCTTGSVFKFGPDGGAVHSPAKGQKPDAASLRPPGTKGIEARAGYRDAGVFADAFIEGAVAAYPGYGPFSHSSWGNNLCCTCRTPRFDLDRYGRLYLPNAITNSVRIVDNAGNQILEFGRYGNFDSLYVNPNLPEGKAGKPTVVIPDIPLGWPTGAGVSRDAIYVCDTYSRRGVRVEYTFAAEETCAVK